MGKTGTVSLETISGPDKYGRDQLLFTLGQNLRTHRVLANVTQQTLAERSFLGSGQISRFERGKAAPNLLVLLLLADAAGVGVGELASGLAAPSRRASREQILALVAQQPGIRTAELAGSLGLPPRYAFQTARRMHSYGEIVGRQSGWQPQLDSTREGQWWEMMQAVLGLNGLCAQIERDGGVWVFEGDSVTVVIGRFEPLLGRGLECVMEDRGLRVLASGVADAALEEVVARQQPGVTVMGETVEYALLARLKASQSAPGVLVLAHDSSVLSRTMLLGAGATINAARCRLTLVASDGHVEKAFFPVSSPERSAAQVSTWLKINR